MNEEYDLVRFCVGLDFNNLRHKLIEHTKLVILDTIGVIVAGFQANPSYEKFADEIETIAPGKATVLGLDITCAEGYAALLNGTAATCLELDEGNRFCGGHPAVHIIPAAIALSEMENQNGKEFITAIVAGYEIASRIGRAIMPAKENIHPHGTWGVVGAAIACAKLLRFDIESTYQTATLASNYSLNTSFDAALEGATVRDTYCGVANFLGILSARLSQNKFTGIDRGIARQFSNLGQNGFRESCLVDSIGRQFEISTNYFKIHASCRYTHGALDCLNQILLSHGPFILDDITSIKVFTWKFAAKLNNPNPKNSLQAKFSIPYAIAARLFYGSSGIDSFTEDSITAEVLNIAKKVTVTDKNQFNRQLPQKRPTAVIIYFNKGEKISSSIDICEGDTTKPYSPQIIKDKFISLVSSSLGSQKAVKIMKKIELLQDIKNIQTLTSLFNLRV